MSEYQTVAVPFRTSRNSNRRFLTRQQLAESSWLADFVGCFKHCFEWDDCAEVLWFIENDIEQKTGSAA